MPDDDVNVTARDPLTQVDALHARIAQLEEQLTNALMRESGKPTFEESSSHWRALAVTLSGPWSYPDARQAVHALGINASEDELRAWLAANIGPTSPLPSAMRLTQIAKVFESND